MLLFRINIFIRVKWILMLLFIIVQIAAQGNKEISETKLIIGGSYDYPPYSYLDEKGNPAGFSVDLSKAIAKVLHKDSKLILEAWSNVRKHLEDGETNLIHDISFSEKRAEVYDFSVPFHKSPFAVFAKKGSPKVNNIEDMAGRRIIVIKGDMGQDFITEKKLTTSIHPVDSYADAILLLEKGEFDYALLDQLVGLYWIKTLGAENIVLEEYSPFYMKYCYAAKKGNEEILLEINGALSILKKNGTYDEIFNKWMNLINPFAFTWKEFLYKYLWMFAVIGGVIFLLFIWNYTLRKKVLQRTAELNKSNISLQESEEKLRTLFGAMTELVVVYECVVADGLKNYFIRDCNTSFIKASGKSKEELIGKSVKELNFNEFVPDFEESVKKAAAGEAYEFVTFLPQLDKHFAVSIISPKKNRFAAIATDITGIKQIEETIISKNIELENYLYVASHDLRSPLVNIQGFSQRLQEFADSIKEIIRDCNSPDIDKTEILKICDEEIPQSLTYVFSNVKKMDTLIRGLLQISRTGRINMEVEKIDMNNFIKSIIDSNNYQISEISATIKINELPQCYGDRNLLNQLFSNIIGNAIKYRKNDVPLVIEISGEEQFNKAVYIVKDNGVGIEDRYLEKIWNIFFRVDPRSPEAGEGLGLSIVKRIVEKHKGKIFVESEYGKGSTFIVHLQKNEFIESVF